MGAPARSPDGERSGGCIRGAAFREFVIWYERRFGSPWFHERLARMPGWMQNDLDVARADLGIGGTRWYPDITVHKLLDLLLEGFTPGQRHALAREAAEHGVNAAFYGGFRLLLSWLVNPRRYAAHAPKLWASYFDSGELTIVPGADGLGAVTTIRHWGTHHPFLCDLTRAASVSFYEAMDCRNVSCVREACVSDGDSECRLVTRYLRAPR
jgi:hypothetical protein